LRRQAPLKRRQTYARLHGAKTQKTAIFKVKKVRKTEISNNTPLRSCSFENQQISHQEQELIVSAKEK
jgi:hypothetical protein